MQVIRLIFYPNYGIFDQICWKNLKCTASNYQRDGKHDKSEENFFSWLAYKIILIYELNIFQSENKLGMKMHSLLS